MSTALLVSLGFVLGLVLIVAAVPRPRQPRLLTVWTHICAGSSLRGPACWPVRSTR
jgi:hypothetical protein